MWVSWIRLIVNNNMSFHGQRRDEVIGSRGCAGFSGLIAVCDAILSGLAGRLGSPPTDKA